MFVATVFASLAVTLAAPRVSLDHSNVHPERLSQIEKIQNTPGITWKAAAHPRFASQPPGASKPLCGVIGSWKEDVEQKIATGEIERFQPKDVNMDIPESFDSATAFPQCADMINDIRDQSNCGCCWAFGGAEAASDRMCIATKGKMNFPFSAQDVCFCASISGCNGGQITTPWTHIKNQGTVSGGQYQGTGYHPDGQQYCADFTLPHCHHHGPVGNDPYPAENTPGCESQRSPSCPKKCDSNATAPHNDFKNDKYTFTGSVQSASGETAIQQMIMEGGPVETAFTVYSDFENYAGGVYKHTTGSMAGGHAVKFVGWGVDQGVKYWKVANSWNPYWGENGYFRIVRGDDEGNGGIEDSVTGAHADATWKKHTPFY